VTGSDGLVRVPPRRGPDLVALPPADLVATDRSAVRADAAATGRRHLAAAHPGGARPCAGAAR
jgi:hypothetical protein